MTGQRKHRRPQQTARKSPKATAESGASPERRLRLEALEDRHLLSAGALDLSFDGDGQVITPVRLTDFTDQRPTGVAVQADGKVVAAGYTYNGNDNDFALARYTVDGNLDTSFGVGGTLTTDFGSSSGDEAHGVAVQADGKIVVAGSSNGQFAVARYNVDGSLDTGFDGDGMLTTSIGSWCAACGVAIQDDGKVVVAGSSGDGSWSVFAVVRYNADGSLDTGFGTGGQATTHIGSYYDDPRSLAIQPDGKIVVAGSAYNNGVWKSVFALARYNTDGSLDTGFDGDGIVLTNVGTGDADGYSVAIQDDSKIVMAGSTRNSDSDGVALVRYNADGSLDTGFDGDGMVRSRIGSWGGNCLSVAIQDDGKVVAAGSADEAGIGAFAVTRYNADGSLDTGFDGDGTATADFGTSNAWANSVAIQPDGKIVAAGPHNNGRNDDFAAARYNADGSLDSGFDGDGMVTAVLGLSSRDDAHGVAVQADGKIVVAGNSDNGSHIDFALARYGADGNLDASFGVGGKLITDFASSSNDEVRGVALQADGKIVVAGASGGMFAVARYNVDGSLDTGFDGDGMLTTSIGSWSEAYGVAIQTDGKIVVSGSSESRFAVARYSTDGSPDTDFGAGGQVTTLIGPHYDDPRGLAIQPDGKIVVVGTTYDESYNNVFALARYNTDGSLDTSLDGDGMLTTNVGLRDAQGYRVAIQTDGKIVAAGSTYNNGSNDGFALVRYNADGSLDTGFDGDGVVMTPIGESGGNCYSVAIQADGKIVAAGAASEAGSGCFALARYTADGSLDTSFNDDGTATAHIGTSNAATMAMALQPDAKLVLAGNGVSGTGAGFAVARFLNDPPPTVTSVSATLANGAYGVGIAVPITLTFSSPVLVSGAPELTLETGTMDRAAQYAAGSGTETLTFNYLVQAGDATGDLGYTSTASLALSGGSIRLAVGVPADLTLPEPGTSGSLGANKDLMIDTAAPTANILSGPAAMVNSTSATFGFQSSDPLSGGVASGVAYLEYRLDGGSYSTASSPVTLTGLGDGSHTFEVRAVDVAGNVGVPAGSIWTVDTVCPDTNITAQPAGLTNSTRASFGFGGSDDRAPVGSLVFEANLDGGDFRPVTSPVTLVDLQDGEHTFLVRAKDEVGNVDASPAGYTWTVDTLGPEVTVSDPLVASTVGGPVSYTVTYTDPHFDACTLGPDQITLNNAGTASGTVSVSGSGNVWTVTITDVVGNGALGISIAAGTARDLSGNLTAAVGPSGTFAVQGARDLAIRYSSPLQRVQPGDSVVVTLNYANLGDQVAQGAALRQSLPDHTTFDAAASSLGWVDQGGGVYQLDLGRLLPGAEGTATFALLLESPMPAGTTEVIAMGAILETAPAGDDFHPENGTAIAHLELYGRSAPGLYSPEDSLFLLRNTNDCGMANVSFSQGAPQGGIPIAGDWDGDGQVSVGLYVPETSVFYLRNSLTAGDADLSFGFGEPGAGWLPIAGDWDGNGTVTIGLYAPDTSLFYLRNSLTAGVADRSFGFGVPAAGWLPIAGDWTGKGTDSIGLYNPAASVFYLRDSNTVGMADHCFGYGAPGVGWLPIAGDWTGKGTDSIGLYNPAASVFYLRDSNTVGMADHCFGYGAPGAGWLPIVGDWIGRGAKAAQPQAIDARTVDQIDLPSIVAQELGHMATLQDETSDGSSMRILLDIAG